MIAPGGRASWFVWQIHDYLARLSNDLERIAVDDPSKITDAKLPDALHTLASRYVANHGHTLGDDAFISVSRPLTQAESADLTAANHKELADTLDAVAKLDVIRSWLVVAGLLPTIAPAAIGYLETITHTKMQLSPAQLRTLAIDILDQAVTGQFVGPA